MNLAMLLSEGTGRQADRQTGRQGEVFGWNLQSKGSVSRDTRGRAAESKIKGKRRTNWRHQQTQTVPSSKCNNSSETVS